MVALVVVSCSRFMAEKLRDAYRRVEILREKEALGLWL